MIYKSARSGSWSNFYFTYELPIIPALFVEKLILSPLNCLCSFIKNQLTVYFWTLYSAPLVYVSVYPFTMNRLDY